MDCFGEYCGSCCLGMICIYDLWCVNILTALSYICCVFTCHWRLVEFDEHRQVKCRFWFCSP